MNFFFSVNSYICFYHFNCFIFTRLNLILYVRFNIWKKIYNNRLFFDESKNSLSIKYFLSTFYVDDIDSFDIYKRTFFINNSKYLDNNSSEKRKYIKKKKVKDFDYKSTIYNDIGIPDDIFVSSLFKFFKNRFGVGKKIVYYLNMYKGVIPNSFVNLNLLFPFFFKTDYISFFVINKNQFDLQKIKLVFFSYVLHKKKFTYKGWCFLNNYPVNGQRRRSNYNTTRNYNRTRILRIYR